MLLRDAVMSPSYGIIAVRSNAEVAISEQQQQNFKDTFLINNVQRDCCSDDSRPRCQTHSHKSRGATEKKCVILTQLPNQVKASPDDFMFQTVQTQTFDQLPLELNQWDRTVGIKIRN
ncbi:hypothetical protein F2P81_017433 [Scophthalmus maximus]|uniref:Uncharacterized protein n=1 Tax=Scophthalmus maximus TaxID=52904 RepID=A0A6A4SK19_SCOMX|nr:hypothetical protein F2P81_017433 [Scophthalmus maximus]